MILLSLLFVGVVVSTSRSVISQGDPPWTHKLNLLHVNGVLAQWKNTPGEEDGNPWFEMEVTAKTEGYIGIGFSPHGGMIGADMAIAWQNFDGKGELVDFYGVKNGLPIKDPEQNYELLSATQLNGWTTIRFRRKWDTCDENDIALRNDTMRFIWALGDTDPQYVNGNLTLTWHGLEGRGAQSLFIADNVFPYPFPDERPDLFPSVLSWNMTMDNNFVDEEATTYFCKIVKFPHLEKKHHMIGWKPILSPENAKNVHHIVFYECMVPQEFGGTESIFDKHTKHSGGRCYTKNMPPEWSKHCVTFLFVWVAGSEGEMFPTHVGSPLGEMHGGASYFMMEVHYDNPTHRTFTDTSGVQIFYTDKLRENDGSVMLMGYRITPFLLLPPKQDNFITHGICSSECTEAALPKDGIHIINTLLHAHFSGKKLRVRHIRNGTELPIPAEDNYYDFNYQQSKTLTNEITILPGDELITECEYHTKNNNRIVLGGLSTTQEMCQFFFVYYPRIDLMQCTSQYEFHDFFKGLGIDEVEGDVLASIKMPYDPTKLTPQEAKFDPTDNAKELEETGDGASFKSLFDHINITSPREKRGISVGQYLKDVNWEDKAMAKGLEKNWQTGKHYAYCTGHGRKRHPLKKFIIPYPEIKEPLVSNELKICK